MYETLCTQDSHICTCMICNTNLRGESESVLSGIE